MFREEVAKVTGAVAAVRMICKYNLTGEARDDALALLDEAEDILTRPSELSEDGQRAQWRADKAAYRKKKKGHVSADNSDTSADSPKTSPRTLVGVEVVEAAEVEAVEAEEGAAVDAVVGVGGDIAAVNAHYLTHHPRAAKKLPAKSIEYRRIKTAIRDLGFTVDDCVDCIDGYHRSPFHLGANDTGQKHLGLSLIFRDADHIAKGIEMASDQMIDRGMSAQERRGVQASQAWLDRTSGGI